MTWVVIALDGSSDEELPEIHAVFGLFPSEEAARQHAAARKADDTEACNQWGAALDKYDKHRRALEVELMRESGLRHVTAEMNWTVLEQLGSRPQPPATLADFYVVAMLEEAAS